MTIAHNTSSNSIYLSWKPPPPDTIFGEFLGYRITYHIREVKMENVINEILIRESSVEVSIEQQSELVPSMCRKQMKCRRARVKSVLLQRSHKCRSRFFHILALAREINELNPSTRMFSCDFFLAAQSQESEAKKHPICFRVDLFL